MICVSFIILSGKYYVSNDLSLHLVPNVSNNKPKINPKPVVVSSNNSAPKLHFPVVAAKAFDPQSSILTPIKEPAKPNVNAFCSSFLN